MYIKTRESNAIQENSNESVTPSVQPNSLFEITSNNEQLFAAPIDPSFSTDMLRLIADTISLSNSTGLPNHEIPIIAPVILSETNNLQQENMILDTCSSCNNAGHARRTHSLCPHNPINRDQITTNQSENPSPLSTLSLTTVATGENNNSATERWRLDSNTRSLNESNGNWDRIRATYEVNIRKGPDQICTCCGGLFFSKDIKFITRATMLNDWKIHHLVVEKCFWAIDTNVFTLHGITADPENKDNTIGQFCSTCKSTIKTKNAVPRLALSQGFHFPDIVPCLEDLTRLEERLVAARHVFQSIWTHKGLHGQYRSKGGIVNVPVDVDTTVSSLPRNLDDSYIVHLRLARKLSYQKDYIRGNISTAKVWRAAQYLQQQSLYQKYHIQLDDQWMLESDRSIANTVENQAENSNSNNDVQVNQDNETVIEEPINAAVDNQENTVENSEANVEEPLNPANQESLIVADTEALRLAPAEGQIPISIINDPDSDYLSFVKIFCGQKLNTCDNVSYSDISKSIARRFDRRAAQRTDYILYMDRKNQLVKMKSNINIILRKRTKVNDNNEQYAAADFSNQSSISGLLSQDQAYKTFTGIRSSSEYWKNQKKNVLAMIRQFGIPTLFVTVSAAETKWYELLCILKKVVDNETINEAQAKELTYIEKSRLIQSDPITCARYFDYRFRQLKKTWSSKDGPFAGYKVCQYYFRTEYQHRGSAHIHMLLWLEGAPLLCDDPSRTESSKKEVCDFIDSVISCDKRWDGSPHHRNVEDSSQETWMELIQYQTHSHTSTCQRKRNKKTVCRFNIPFYPIKETVILSPFLSTDISANESTRLKDINHKVKNYLDANCNTLVAGSMTIDDFLTAVRISSYEEYINSIRSTLQLTKVFIRRETNAITVNNFNRRIISMFRSNMDIQFITDPYACCTYVVDYINKADRGLSKTLEEVYNKHKEDPSSTSFDMLKSLAATYYNSSEISAQEAAYNILCIRMAEASTAVTFIPTSSPEKRIHILKDFQTLAQLNPDSTDCFQAGLVEHYAQRPDCLENINLAQFASYYDVTKSKPKPRAVDIENDDPENINEDDQEENETEEEAQVDDSNVNSNLINNNTITPGTVLRLKNNSRYIKRRHKNLVIRYYPSNIDTDRADYFRILAMLFLSWRNEEEELLNVNCEEIFDQNKDNILEAKKEFCSIDDFALESYMDLLAENQENEINDGDPDEEDTADGTSNRQLSRGSDPIEDFRRYTIDINDSNEGDYHRTNNLSDELGSIGRSNRNQTYYEKMSLPNNLSDEEYFQLLSLLNIKQRDYITHVMDHIRYNKERRMHQMFDNDNQNQQSNLTFKPFHHMVTGGAGVGKSMLIKALYQSLIREFDRSRDRDMNTPSALLCAPTGKAAFNISGITLHPAFQLPVNQFGGTTIASLSSDVSHSMAVTLRDLQVVIIDEISMVGDVNFGYVDKRLRDIFDRDLPFGGKSVILFGDFKQLPPVGSTPIYSDKAVFWKNPIASMLGVNLWHMFIVHTLEQIMRQRNDVAFAVALNNMAVGTMTGDDIRLLQSRVLRLTPQQLDDIKRKNSKKTPNDEKVVLGHLNSEELAQSRPVCLFFSNDDVNKGNNQIISSMMANGETPVLSVAFDRVTGSRPTASAVQAILNSASDSASNLKNGGLYQKLVLQVGARYMMTVNVDTTDGLVNGATGYLRKIDFGRLTNNSPGANGSSSSREKPLRIWIEFDDERSGRKLRANQNTIRNQLRMPDGTQIPSAWTLIVPYSSIVNQNRKTNLNLHRTQFPLFPAECLTVHKSQGGTYDQVVAYDTGKKRMSRFLLYVACARATKAEGLTLICKNNQFVPPKSLFEENDSELRKEIQERMPTVKLALSFEHLSARSSSQNQEFQVISHNVQSLRRHIDQISNDYVYLSSEILLFNETWTVSSNEEYNIPGFTMIARVDSHAQTPNACGACIFIKTMLIENLSESYVVDSRLFQSTDNNSSVSVALLIFQNVLYCSIYASPGCSIELIIESLEFVIDHDYVFITIAGDFNTDFATQSSKTVTLLNFMHSHGLYSSLPDTIKSTTRSGTFIDNIFTNQEPLCSRRYLSFTSYHEPLWIKF